MLLFSHILQIICFLNLRILQKRRPIQINLFPTRVNIHLEKFNEQYNLLHIGISFDNRFKVIRYDYRPFNDNNDYDTTNIDRRNFAIIFPNVYIPEDINIPEEMEKKTIHWGNTNKTFNEIIAFEKTLHKKYILGINDCRHYVSKFTEWALEDPTPIWHLNSLWDEY